MRVRKRDDVHNNYPVSRKPQRPYTPEDEQQLLYMRDVLKMRWYLIDRAQGRGNGSSFQKYSALKAGPAPSLIGSYVRVQAPPEQLADRDARYAASNLMTPTAAFFGDPPPGYSALDQRQGAK